MTKHLGIVGRKPPFYRGKLAAEPATESWGRGERQESTERWDMGSEKPCHIYSGYLLYSDKGRRHHLTTHFKMDILFRDTVEKMENGRGKTHITKRFLNLQSKDHFICHRKM